MRKYTSAHQRNIVSEAKTTRSKLTAGHVLRFNYSGAAAHVDRPLVFVLHPDYDGKLHGITLDYIPESTLVKLSKIVKALNEAFGTNFTEDDKVFLGRVKDNLLENKDLINKMENNSKQNVKAVFDKFFNEEMTKLLNSNMKVYKRIVDNDKLRNKLKIALFDLVYFEHNKKKRDKKKLENKGIT